MNERHRKRVGPSSLFGYPRTEEFFQKQFLKAGSIISDMV